jgi:hypothetical protein
MAEAAAVLWKRCHGTAILILMGLLKVILCGTGKVILPGTGKVILRDCSDEQRCDELSTPDRPDASSHFHGGCHELLETRNASTAGAGAAASDEDARAGGRPPAADEPQHREGIPQGAARCGASLGNRRGAAGALGPQGCGPAREADAPRGPFARGLVGRTLPQGDRLAFRQGPRASRHPRPSQARADLEAFRPRTSRSLSRARPARSPRWISASLASFSTPRPTS